MLSRDVCDRCQSAYFYDGKHWSCTLEFYGCDNGIGHSGLDENSDPPFWCEYKLEHIMADQRPT